MVSPHARQSYLAISAIVRRQLSTSSSLKPRPTGLRHQHHHRTPQHRSEHLSHRRIPASTRSNSTYSRNDFSNQGFTGFYEPGAPTMGPLAEASNIGAPRITPQLLKQHLDAFVVGQDRAKKTLATAVYNHYQRIQELQRRDEEEQEMLAQDERRRVAELRRHPVEGREHELKRGIEVPSLTKNWEQDEFPGQQHTVNLWPHQGPGEEPQHLHAQRLGPSDFKTSNSMPPPAPPPPLFDPTPLTIEKSNILLLGPSGVGKTLMAKTLARVLEVPFSISDCTPFTQAGYIGEDAEVCVQRLLAAANYDVARAERGIICLDEVDKIATAKVSHGKDVSGEGVQQALLKIIEGTTLQIQAKQERGAPSGSSGGGSGSSRPGGYPTNSPLSGGNMSQQGPTGGGGGGKNEVYNVRTDNILFICAGAFNGLHKMILDRISKGSIGFGATVRSVPGANTSSDGALHETMLEGEDELFEKHLPYYTPPEDVTVSTPGKKQSRRFNTLDLVEPQDLQKFGLIPELVGRIPISCALSSLDIEALVKVLTEPRNSLLKQYEQLFQLSSIELRFTSPALRVVAAAAAKMGTGARGLRTVMERLLADSMFETPGSGIKHVLVNEDVANKVCGTIYFGRGQQGRFHAAIAAEEEAWEARKRAEEEGERESSFERRARVNSQGGAARTFEEYREKTSAAGFV